jgi:hypothetical protein
MAVWGNKRTVVSTLLRARRLGGTTQAICSTPVSDRAGRYSLASHWATSQLTAVTLALLLSTRGKYRSRKQRATPRHVCYTASSVSSPCQSTKTHSLLLSK